jgi:hypothetical protein
LIQYKCIRIMYVILLNYSIHFNETQGNSNMNMIFELLVSVATLFQFLRKIPGKLWRKFL